VQNNKPNAVLLQRGFVPTSYTYSILNLTQLTLCKIPIIIQTFRRI